MNKSVLIACLLVALAGCGAGEEPSASSSGAGAQRNATLTGSTCDGKPGVSRAEEPDYPDWIFLNDKHYALQGPAAAPVELGNVVVKIRCQLIGSGTRNGYKPQNGDATSLGAGVEVFAVKNQDPGRVVATRTADGIEIWGAE